jgi:hypothetical protein
MTILETVMTTFILDMVLLDIAELQFLFVVASSGK